MAVSDAFSYDRDEIAQSLAAYYSVLARACYFSPEDIQSPPTGGWSDLELDVDALRALRRSDKVIDLLRHIPYIKPCKRGDKPVQWPILVRSRAIRYLRDDGDFSDWSARGGDGLAELANAPFDQTPAGPMDLPSDVVALSRGYGSSDFGSPWCIIDCETGILTPYTSGTGPTDKPWQTSRCSARVFFDEMTSFLKSKTIIALPPVGELEPEIMGSESDQKVDVRQKFQWIYQARGWATFEEDPSSWRREECIDALKRFRIELWEAEKKRLAHEADFDDPEDEDFEDSDPDAGSEASQSEIATEDVDTALEAEDISVDVSKEELAEVWADLDETEYMMIDEELKGEGVQYAFHPSKPPQRLARAPSYEYNGPGASQVRDQTRCNDSIETMAGAIKRHYLTLSRAAYFPPSMVETAPDSGWSDDVFPMEELGMLGYSDKAVSLLRHLPYLGLDEHFWEVLPGSQPIRYLRDAELFEDVPRDKLRRDSLRKLGLSPYDEAMPADVVALSAPNQDSWRGTWWMIDAGRVAVCSKGVAKAGKSVFKFQGKDYDVKLDKPLETKVDRGPSKPTSKAPDKPASCKGKRLEARVNLRNKDITRVITQGPARQEIVRRTCYGDTHGQACYHYKSVIDRDNKLSRLTCPGQKIGEALRPVVGSYNKQHNTDWSSGWLQQDNLVCQRDEYPPADIWRSRDDKAVWIRLLPQASNGGAGQLFGGCPEKQAEELIHEGFHTTENVGCRVVTITTRRVRAVEKVIELNFERMGGMPDDYGVEENPCWPKTLNDNDPGFALLNNDDWYKGAGRAQQRGYRQYYSKAPTDMFTIDANGVAKVSIYKRGWTPPRKRKADEVKRREVDPLDIVVSEGNTTRQPTEEELLEDFGLVRCRDGSCEKEMHDLGYASLPVSGMKPTSPPETEASTTMAVALPTSLSGVLATAADVAKAAAAVITAAPEYDAEWA